MDLGVLAVNEPVAVLTDRDNRTVLAVLTVGTVLTVLAVLAAGSSNAGVLTVDEPVTVLADLDNRTVLAVLTVGTVLTIHNVVRTLVGGNLDTTGDLLNIGHNLAIVDLSLEIGEFLGQLGDLLVQLINVSGIILLARHSSNKCDRDGCTSQEKLELLVHKCLELMDIIVVVYQSDSRGSFGRILNSSLIRYLSSYQL